MSRASRARVVAVVVAAADVVHLRETLAALAHQEVAPDETVLVRTHADLDAEALLRETGVSADVVDVLDVTGPGEAAVRALAGRRDAETGWLWLLHDDSAPEPGALAALTAAVETGRSIAIAGCKQVGWTHPDRLLSVGVQYTPDIQRYTGIEEGEVDQGQHDDREDVDAVGTAGMLVDLEVLRSLGGPDPALGPFGDGRDLSRRARLAGHRVVVVPRAVVRHARLGYLGLRRDGRQAEADRGHSLRQRRTSVLHARLAEVPTAAVPLVALAAVLAAPVRAVGRLVSKELRLVVDELVAPLLALAGLPAVARARRRARATRTGSARRLRPLQASWRDVARVRRDRRLQASAQRRTTRTPSELEMRERSALAVRRRLVLACVTLVTAGVAVATLAPTLLSGPQTGGALLPLDGTLGQVWSAVASPWLVSGDGTAVPADPFLAVVAVLSFLTGGAFGTPLWVTVSVVLAAAVPLAGLSAWFTAGAATRSLSLRAWAALVWALAPALTLGLAGGRLGAVVAHVVLPLVALGIARAFGLDRRDVVVSGLVGAQRVARRTATAPAAEARQRRLAALAAVGDDAPTAQIDRMLAGEPVPIPVLAETPSEEEPDADDVVHAPEESEPPVVPSQAVLEEEEPEEREYATIVARPSGVGSVGAAAGAGLALAVVVAGAPVLLPAALLALVLLAVLLGRRRSLVVGRARLLLVALPPLVLLGPLLTRAAQVDGGWRLLVAAPGAPSAAAAVEPWQALLGWPAATPEVGLGAFAAWLPLAASATVVVAALVALGRGSRLARGVRLAWLLSAIGLAAALVAPRVAVGTGVDDAGASTLVHGWSGPGTSLVVLGLVMATVTAGGGLRAALHGRSFGWRQLAVAVVSVVLVAGVLVSAVGWVTMLRGTAVLATRSDDPVPAIGDELQASDDRARVLALWAGPGGVVDAALWRASGPQLTEASSAAELAALDGGDDPAADDLAALVAGLATGTVTDTAARLADHAVGVVVVPPVDSVVAGPGDDVERSRLVSLLDSVRGLERVTENAAGIVWRVSTADATVARVVLRADDGTLTPVAAEPVGVSTRIGPVETASTLVLAERADSRWRASLDGVPLRTVADGWRQALAVPAGSGGDLVVRYDPPLHTPWQVVVIATFVLTVLIAIPVRRRRVDDGEDA